MTKELIMIGIVDVSEIENDGEYGAFVVTLEYEGTYAPVLVCYSLADNQAIAKTSTLPADVLEELILNPELMAELKEAVMAERDAKDDENKRLQRVTKFSETKEQEATNGKKWELN